MRHPILLRNLNLRLYYNMAQSKTTTSSQRRMEHLKLMNFTMDVNEEKVEATVRTSGLHYSDFDSKNALPKPWQLMKLLEAARFFSHHWPIDESGRTFRDYEKLTFDRRTFMVTSSFTMTEALYNTQIPKCPLDIKIQGGYIGNTSLNSIATVVATDGTELLSNVNQVVSIGRETRRPMPLPDWWKTKYAKSAESFSSLKLSKFEKCTDDMAPFKVNVVRSDLDGNNHVNWSCYVRISLDGVYHFAKKGALVNLANVDKLGLKKMELMYSGESFDDDELNVYVWEDEQKPFAACVQVFKDNNLIFQAGFEYFEKEIVS